MLPESDHPVVSPAAQLCPHHICFEPSEPFASKAPKLIVEMESGPNIDYNKVFKPHGCLAAELKFAMLFPNHPRFVLCLSLIWPENILFVDSILKILASKPSRDETCFKHTLFFCIVSHHIPPSNYFFSCLKSRFSMWWVERSNYFTSMFMFFLIYFVSRMQMRRLQSHFIVENLYNFCVVVLVLCLAHIYL